MSTRALIRFQMDGKTFFTIYKQSDGYITGLGSDIKRILNRGDVKITEGIDGYPPAFFDGVEDMAAYFIGKLKGNNAGEVYVWPTSSKIPSMVEYVYTIKSKGELVWLKIDYITDAVKKLKTKIYSGLLKDFNPKQVDKAFDEAFQ